MPDANERLEELVDQFLCPTHGKLTGTLRVTCTDSRAKQILFLQGSIADLDTGREESLLQAALMDTGALSEKDIRHARKAAAKGSQPLSAAILDLGIVTDENLEESIRARFVSEICEVFEWPLGTVEFFEHKEDERLESFFSELTDYYEVLIDPEEVFLEAMRRLNRWDIIRTKYPGLKDVLYATPSSFHYFRDPEQYPNEHQVLSKVDGVKDVDEVIAESGMDPFLGVCMVRQLRARGELELINPVQMYQLGVDSAAANQFEKACKLFQRAYERGLDDFDLQLKLAQALDALGRKEEAIQRYMEFTDKCLSQLRVEEGIRSLKRIIQLDPNLLEAQDKYLDVLLQQNRPVEAVDQAVILAEKMKPLGDLRACLDLLLRVRTVHPKSLKLQQKIVEFAEACNDWRTARAERESLARNSEEQKDTEVALETYQKLFCEGNDSMEVRLKLVELHRAKGNVQRALDHITSILNLPEKRRPQSEAVLLQLHQMVREMKPTDLRSNRWLVDYHMSKGDKAKCVEILTQLIASLERDGDSYEQVHAYERLLSIEDRYEHRWGLAKAQERLGKVAEARREIRCLANLALRRKEFDQAAKAIEETLKCAPLDIEARKLQCELHESRGDTDAALRSCEDIALLEILCGNVQEAEQYCRHLPAERSSTPEIVRRIGGLCWSLGDAQKAAEQLIKAAKLHLDQRNLGLCAATLDELFKVQPSHAEGLVLQAKLKEKEAAPAAAAPPAAPAVAQSAAAPAQLDSQVSAESPAKEEPAQIFQLSSPLKTTVMAITAKLKRLKSGGQDGGAGAPAGPGEDTSAGAPASAGAEATEGSGEAHRAGLKQLPASAALKSAASRLKALAGKKGMEAAAGTAPSAGALTAAAAQPAGQPSAPSREPAVAPADADAPSAPLSPGGPAPEGPAPTSTIKAKLAKSASKLAQLKKQAAKTT